MLVGKPMSPYVGQMVWACQWPAVGPLAAVVQAVRGQTVDLLILFEAGPQVLTDITPWPVEDGTLWGWLPITADGAIPPDLFA